MIPLKFFADFNAIQIFKTENNFTDKEVKMLAHQTLN